MWPKVTRCGWANDVIHVDEVQESDLTVDRMKHQLLPKTEIAPSLPDDITSAGAVRVWIDLMKSVDKLVMAGFVSQVGREHAGDAYRRWFSERAERHGDYTTRLAHRLREIGNQ